MPRFIAFLRAINVGGRVVKMERLRQLFESSGHAKVETFIASGNVIFESPARNAASLQSRIEKILERELGYEVKAFLRSDAELAKIAIHQPFDAGGEGRLFIGFLAAKPSAIAAAKLLAAETETDEFCLNGRELYWRLRGNASDSKFSGPLLEKNARRLGDGAECKHGAQAGGEVPAAGLKVTRPSAYR